MDLKNTSRTNREQFQQCLAETIAWFANPAENYVVPSCVHLKSVRPIQTKAVKHQQQRSRVLWRRRHPVRPLDAMHRDRMALQTGRRPPPFKRPGHPVRRLALLNGDVRSVQDAEVVAWRDSNRHLRNCESAFGDLPSPDPLAMFVPPSSSQSSPSTSRHWDELAAVRAHQAPPTETELDDP
jgi:hypothetical protein